MEEEEDACHNAKKDVGVTEGGGTCTETGQTTPSSSDGGKGEGGGHVSLEQTLPPAVPEVGTKTTGDDPGPPLLLPMVSLEGSGGGGFKVPKIPDPKVDAIIKPPSSAFSSSGPFLSSLPRIMGFPYAGSSTADMYPNPPPPVVRDLEKESAMDKTINEVIACASLDKENTDVDVDPLRLSPILCSSTPNLDSMIKLVKVKKTTTGFKSKSKSKTLMKLKNKKMGETRGRKSKKWMLENGHLLIQTRKYRKRKNNKNLLAELNENVNADKPTVESGRKATPSPAVPSEYTKKEILDAVYLDHNYCQVLYSANRSKVQPFRHLFGPKDEFKATFVPETLISPNKYLPHVPVPPSPSPPPASPPVKSKLELLLLKGGTATPSPPSSSGGSKRSSTPSSSSAKKYWEFHDETDEELDVVTPDEKDVKELIPYDAAKAKNLMLQCDQHSKIIRSIDDDNWESQIMKTGWTSTQRKLFDNVIKALHGERLSRLAYDGNPAEPVLRRCSLDRTARKIRCALMMVQWNSKLTQWLHGVLIENLNQTYLAIYLDVLQTLKAVAPSLVDKMIVLSKEKVRLPSIPILESLSTTTNPVKEALSSISENTSESNNNSVDEEKRAVLQEVLSKKANNLSVDALSLLLKKPWDPFSPVVHPTKVRRITNEPVFLYVPCVSPTTSPSCSKRFKNFLTMFSALGKVITINVHGGNVCSVAKFAKKLLTITKEKIVETRRVFPDKPLFLIGWGTGSIVATTVSVTHQVDGVVALSFPLFGLAGPRGTLDDPVLDMKKPVMFVIGGRSPDVTLTDMELLRKQLSCESSLVIIGSGDKNLRLSRAHRERLLVTQSWVDKCIVDEIAYFVNLHSRHPLNTPPNFWLNKSRNKSQQSHPHPVERKRMMSTASSSSRFEAGGPSMPIPMMQPLPLLSDMPSLSRIDVEMPSFGPEKESCLTTTTTPLILKSKSKKKLYEDKSEPNAAKRPKTDKKKMPGSGSSGFIGDDISLPQQQRKQSDDPDYVSPVLSYLGATPGQGGLLHNLLSPTTPTTTHIPPSSSSNANASIPILLGDAGKVSSMMMMNRPTLVKIPKKVRARAPAASTSTSTGPVPPPPSSVDKDKSANKVAVLAGGATATAVPGPVIPTFTSMDSMRQYVLQHQHVMQKHLHHIQTSSLASSQSPQLLRLLSPPLSGGLPQFNNHPSSAPYAAPVTPDGMILPTKIDAGNIGLPSDTNVTLIKPPSSGEGPGKKPPPDVPRFSAPSVPQQGAIIRTPTPFPLHAQSVSSGKPFPLHTTQSVSSGKEVSQAHQDLIRLVTSTMTNMSSFKSTTTTTTTTTATTSSILPFQPRSLGIPIPVLGEGAQANVVFKTGDKTIATMLSTEDVKSLFAGGILRCNVPGESAPVNIVLKPQQTPIVSQNPIMLQHQNPMPMPLRMSAPVHQNPNPGPAPSVPVPVPRPVQPPSMSSFPIITGVKSLASGNSGPPPPATPDTSTASGESGSGPPIVFAKKSVPLPMVSPPSIAASMKRKVNESNNKNNSPSSSSSPVKKKPKRASKSKTPPEPKKVKGADAPKTKKEPVAASASPSSSPSKSKKPTAYPPKKRPIPLPLVTTTTEPTPPQSDVLPMPEKSQTPGEQKVEKTCDKSDVSTPSQTTKPKQVFTRRSSKEPAETKLISPPARRKSVSSRTPTKKESTGTTPSSSTKADDKPVKAKVAKEKDKSKVDPKEIAAQIFASKEKLEGKDEASSSSTSSETQGRKKSMTGEAPAVETPPPPVEEDGHTSGADKEKGKRKLRELRSRKVLR